MFFRIIFTAIPFPIQLLRTSQQRLISFQTRFAAFPLWPLPKWGGLLLQSTYEAMFFLHSQGHSTRWQKIVKGIGIKK